MQTNARCPNCHKKLEMRGEGDKRMFSCVCGHREKLSDFEKRRSEAGASKGDVRSFLASQNRQNESPGQSALSSELAKWLEQQGDNN